MQNAKLKKIIHSKLLKKFKKISHGFTTKYAGGCQNREIDNIVIPEQVHSNRVVWLDKNTDLKADGIITNKKGTAIGIRTADCVPLLFYESKLNIISAVHAGWKGTLGKIAQKTVRKIVKLGGEAENVIVAIGPCIGMCCYKIDKFRAEKFVKEFGKDKKLVNKNHKGWYLNLAYANYIQLLKSGIKKENIDHQIFCTKCQKNLFFSYRMAKDKKNYSRMLNFIKLV